MILTKRHKSKCKEDLKMTIGGRSTHNMAINMNESSLFFCLTLAMMLVADLLVLLWKGLSYEPKTKLLNVFTNDMLIWHEIVA